jgi:hypothetical protein
VNEKPDWVRARDITDVMRKDAEVRDTLHANLLKCDKDYAFECAVVGEAAVLARHTTEQLWKRAHMIEVTW